MTVAFDLHASVDRYGGRLARTSEIVSSEVHEHHMLGALLFVGKKVLLESKILLLRPASATRAGQRSTGDDLITHAAQNLGAGRDQNATLGLKIDLVGAGIDDPKSSIDVEGIGGRPTSQPLADDGLKDITGSDVFLHVGDRRLETLAREVGGAFRRIMAREIAINETRVEVNQRIGEKRGHLLESARGIPESIPGIGPSGDVAANEHMDPLRDMVEDHQFLVESDMHVGQPAIIVRSDIEGELSRFKPTDGVVSDVSDPASAETVGKRLLGCSQFDVGSELARDRKRIRFTRDPFGTGLVVTNRHLVAIRDHFKTRPRAENRSPTDLGPLPTLFDGFEEKTRGRAVIGLHQSAIGKHWRQSIAHQRPVQDDGTSACRFMLECLLIGGHGQRIRNSVPGCRVKNYTSLMQTEPKSEDLIRSKLPVDHNIATLRGLRKTYFKPDGTVLVDALRGVDLDIPKGQYLAIMGASGSGKSTLMNLLGCLDTPTSGSYSLGGIDVATLPDEELSAIRGRKIGFVFQAFNLISELDIVENVCVPLLYQGISRPVRRKMALEALDQVGLGDRTTHRPRELSGGQQQRVAVARALVTKPAIVLADEPTGNLDSTTERSLLNLFDELHDGGMTMIIVTHEPTLAERCERIIRLKDGSIDSDQPGGKAK